jgi:hypothetical protein
MRKLIVSNLTTVDGVRHESRSFGCFDGSAVMRPPVSPGVSYSDMR